MDCWECIHVARGRVIGAVAKTKFAAAGCQANARRPIPGSVHVPFHIGVENEQISVTVEGGVKRIAVAAAPQLPALAIRVNLVNAGGGWPDAVNARQNREKAVLPP